MPMKAPHRSYQKLCLIAAACVGASVWEARGQAPVASDGSLRQLVQSYYANPVPADLAAMTRPERFEAWLARFEAAMERDPASPSVYPAKSIRLSLLNSLGRTSEALTEAQRLLVFSGQHVGWKCYWNRVIIELAAPAFAGGDHAAPAVGLLAVERLAQTNLDDQSLNESQRSSVVEDMVAGAFAEARLREIAGLDPSPMCDTLLRAAELLRPAASARSASSRVRCLTEAVRWAVRAKKPDKAEGIFRMLIAEGDERSRSARHLDQFGQWEDEARGAVYVARVTWGLEQAGVTPDLLLLLNTGSAQMRLGRMPDAAATFIRGYALYEADPANAGRDARELATILADQAAAAFTAMRDQERFALWVARAAALRAEPVH